jgi:hypothetical protein
MLMGQYKVPQNVETEDKILGPLSIKQFIYIIVGVMWAFLMWRLFSFFLPLAALLALPVTGFMFLLGFGQREGVPFEDYVVAFIRFLTLPRKLEWQKDDAKETIVKDMKPAEIVHTPKNVSQGQLKQLASIIDTRGGGKDPSIQLQEEGDQAANYAARVIGPQTAGAAPITVEGQFATPNDDILDETGERSQGVNQLLQTATVDVHNQAVAQVQNAIQNPRSVPASTPTVPNAAAYVIASKNSNLPVASVAKRANQQQLSPGQPVQLR